MKRILTLLMMSVLGAACTYDVLQVANDLTQVANPPCISRIALIQNTDALYVMNADGSEKTQLAAESNLLFTNLSIDWSPDGQQLLFSNVDIAENAHIQLSVLTLSDESIHQITAERFDYHNAIWSPTGAYIASIRTQSAVSSIWMMNADGTEARALTENGQFFKLVGWSSDESTIYYVSDALYAVNIQNLETELLDDHTLDAALSPDGTQLAVSHPGNTEATITIMDTAGTTINEFTGSEAIDLHWSPDGIRLIYRREWRNIFVLDLREGGSRSPLLNEFEGGGDVAHSLQLLGWSPDGNLILLSYDGDLSTAQFPSGTLNSLAEDELVFAADWSPCLASE